MQFDIVRLSSKGQLVIPYAVRRRLGLQPGTKMALLTDQKTILLKTLPAPELAAFGRMVTNSRKVLKRANSGRNHVSD